MSKPMTAEERAQLRTELAAFSMHTVPGYIIDKDGVLVLLDAADEADRLAAEVAALTGQVARLRGALEMAKRLHHDAALEPCICGQPDNELRSCPACDLATKADEVTDAALAARAVALRGDQ